MSIPVELKSTLDMLRRSFPDGVDEFDIAPVCRLLREDGEMSIRTTSCVMGVLLGCEAVDILPYIDRSTVNNLELVRRAAEIRQILRQHGYEEWLMDD